MLPWRIAELASRSDLLDSLRRVDLFAELTEAQQADLARQFRSKRFDAGQVIFLRGDPGDALYVIASGHVSVGLTSAGGKEVLLTQLGPGDFFGDLALLDGEPRSADCIAQTECWLLVLQEADFAAFLEAEVGVAKRLLAAMSRRLRRNADLIEEVAFLDIGARLARLLLSLAAERGASSGVGVTFAGKLTQTDLANMIGATRESVNKCLAAYQRQGLLTWRSGQLTILDIEGLQQHAQM